MPIESIVVTRLGKDGVECSIHSGGTSLSSKINPGNARPRFIGLRTLEEHRRVCGEKCGEDVPAPFTSAQED